MLGSIKVIFMKEYNKLVRDNICSKLEKKNIPHDKHIADGNEFEQKLFEKLLEEANELMEANNDMARKEEIADVLEVIEAIKALKGFSTDEIEAIRIQKLENVGGFTKRIILDRS